MALLCATAFCDTAIVPGGPPFANQRWELPGQKSKVFWESADLDAFIAKAFCGGLALLTRRKRLSRKQRQSYRAAWLFFQWVRQTREHFGNQLLNTTSLSLSWRARNNSEEKSILPPDIGLGPKMTGIPWTVKRLVEEGIKAAKAQGISRPTEADSIHYGFVQAARANPLEVSPDKAGALVRAALFDVILAAKPTKKSGSQHPFDLQKEVVDRALRAIGRHLEDDARAFNAWFTGPNNTFIKQLASQKKAPGGNLDPQGVRQALQDQGWQAYHQVADCVDAMMLPVR